MKKFDNIKQYAFIVLKPDALKKFLDTNILQELSKENLEIIKRKRIEMTESQVEKIYAEKIHENYYPLLEKFLTEDISMCFILKAAGNAIKESQEFKDKIREKLKINKFKVSNEDLELLRKGRHPLQKEITKEMALENLIHASNNFKEVCEGIDAVFNESEIKEVEKREPGLYQLLLEYRQETKESKELEPHREIKRWKENFRK